MNHLPPASRDALLALFAQIGQQFHQVEADIAQHEGDLKAALERVQEISRRSPLVYSSLPPDHPFRKVAQQSYCHIEQLVAEWLENVARHERNTGFRQRFGDSLLMFVYGKVKAGKSSLGNYLAWGYSNPGAAERRQAEPLPRFFVESSTDACESINDDTMARQQKFNVGVVETTSAIQGFTLPGLTWIDSPGLHSMSGANGRLAREYANCADLIVFLTHSSSPGRRSDLEEISHLQSQSKPLVVLITASDDIETDVDEEGNLVKTLKMKPAHDRQAQIDYVRQEVVNLPQSYTSPLAVYSVSVAWAQADEQAQRWQESGLADFAAHIADLAGGAGLQMKRATPLHNLASFCNELAQSVAQFDAILHQFGQQLEQVRADMRQEAEQWLTRIRIELPPKLDVLAEQYLMDDEGFARACRHLIEDWLKQAASALLAKLGQQLDQFVDASRAVALPDQALPGFGKIHEARSFKTRFAEQAGRAGGSAGLGIVGGILGAPAGPVGIMLGGMLGGLLGNWLGGEAGKVFDKEQIIQIEVGDNRQEVVQAARDHVLKRTHQQLMQLSIDVDQQVFGDMAHWLQQLARALAELGAELARKQQTIEQALATISSQPQHPQ